MTRSLVVRREALDEMEEAAAWYEARRPGLGLEFLAEIDRVTSAVNARPESFPVWKRGFPYRRALAHRFPYAIFFEIDQDLVVISAISHTSRRPGYWLDR